MLGRCVVRRALTLVRLDHFHKVFIIFLQALILLTRRSLGFVVGSLVDRAVAAGALSRLRFFDLARTSLGVVCQHLWCFKKVHKSLDVSAGALFVVLGGTHENLGVDRQVELSQLGVVVENHARMFKEIVGVEASEHVVGKSFSQLENHLKLDGLHTEMGVSDFIFGVSKEGKGRFESR